MTKTKKVYEPMTFTLSAEQVEKYDKWRIKKNKKKGEAYVGAVGGAYSFEFNINSETNVVSKVICVDGEVLDLTE